MDDAVCRSELTPSNSDSSDITVESSHQYRKATPSQPAEWTDEKHNAYLCFLETSFVKQLHELHCSMDLQGWVSQKQMRGRYSSQGLSANACSSSHQFMVLRDGCWQKIKFAEKETLFDNTADSRAMVKHPQIRRFTSAGKLRNAASCDPQDNKVFCDEEFYLRSAEPAGSSQRHHDYHLCHQNLGCSATEVSDQNFVDEDLGDNSNHGSMTKKLKTAAVDSLRDDQVVPLEKPQKPNVSAACHASVEREEQGHRAFLPEHPENFLRSRSGIHIFRRGS